MHGENLLEDLTWKVSYNIHLQTLTFLPFQATMFVYQIVWNLNDDNKIVKECFKYQQEQQRTDCRHVQDFEQAWRKLSERVPPKRSHFQFLLLFLWYPTNPTLPFRLTGPTNIHMENYIPDHLRRCLTGCWWMRPVMTWAAGKRRLPCPLVRFIFTIRKIQTVGVIFAAYFHGFN